MTLRTYYKQAAERTNLLSLRLDFFLEIIVKLLKCLSCVDDFLVIRITKARSLGNHFIIKALLCHFAPCHILRVTAEHNICTTACHIRCDCNRALFTCLRDNLGFLCVVLGIQDLVLNARTL